VKPAITPGGLLLPNPARLVIYDVLKYVTPEGGRDHDIRLEWAAHSAVASGKAVCSSHFCFNDDFHSVPRAFQIGGLLMMTARHQFDVRSATTADAMNRTD
jgi:hypothetical protein